MSFTESIGYFKCKHTLALNLKVVHTFKIATHVNIHTHCDAVPLGVCHLTFPAVNVTMGRRMMPSFASGTLAQTAASTVITAPDWRSNNKRIDRWYFRRITLSVLCCISFSITYHTMRFVGSNR